ncbi:MAG TPA: cyclic pyranopterin monophosphate synthase MoaC [Actinomycetota bacterium]|nr:cyclic pyranopterin monophosphate synthase MoaC [Actinomycetota bacterium]
MRHPETDARMVDVGGKDATSRRAIASALVAVSDATRTLVLERALAKGDALETARIAGIMAAKRTPELIPLCHPLVLDAIEVAIDPVEGGLRVTATVSAVQRTGVEMEALTAVTVAALTIYDMIKGEERGASIQDVRLIEKSGGASGVWRYADQRLR